MIMGEMIIATSTSSFCESLLFNAEQYPLEIFFPVALGSADSALMREERKCLQEVT